MTKQNTIIKQNQFFDYGSILANPKLSELTKDINA